MISGPKPGSLHSVSSRILYVLTNRIMNTLSGKVCLVTGASRGIGKGIAIQLGEAGATVYVTARTLQRDNDVPWKGSLEETVEEIEARGGKGIAVQVDHSNEDEVKMLFEQIRREQNGQLDLLVNNVFSAIKVIIQNIGSPFWDQPFSYWDEVSHVGLRNHYLCSVYAAQMMVPRKQGLIVNVSSAAGLFYTYSVVYGVCQEACDRMALDCAHELKKHEVSYVSLWPGYVRTETMVQTFRNKEYPVGLPHSRKLESNILHGETPEYIGKCIVHLLRDRAILKRSGHVLLTADLGDDYGFTDVDGKKPWSPRSVKYLAHNYLGIPKWIADWIPNFCKVPGWVFYLMRKKF